MLKTDIRIDILGTSFSLTVDEDPVYLQTILGRYSTLIENTQRVTGLQDPLKVAILVGLQLCDDVEKLRTHQLSGEGVVASLEAEKSILALIERIDQALPVNQPVSGA